MKFITLVILAATTIALASCSVVDEQRNGRYQLSDKWLPLLDKELSKWEVWMGVPHASVKGLPNGTYTTNNMNAHSHPERAMGLNNDVKKVFEVIEERGNPVLKISGEIYGGLTTKGSYGNYHLTMEVKWGQKKWEPRLDKKRDSGVLFHCQGAHGAFWRAWKACQEMQIQESDFGDYIPLAGPSGVIQTATEKPLPNNNKYDPDGKYKHIISGYSHASSEPDLPNGQWNKVDIYAVDDKAVFVVNGVQVMAIEDSKGANGLPLTFGQLQIQSEGAEVYYRDINIKRINKLPMISTTPLQLTRPPKGFTANIPATEFINRQNQQFPLSDQQNVGNWTLRTDLTDEFNESEINTQRWFPNNPYWKGRQPTYFDNSNVSFKEGEAIFRVNQHGDLPLPEGYTHSAGFLKSKQRVLYGYFESEAKLMDAPWVSGFWLTMVEKDWWTEIDIAENCPCVDGQRQTINSNVHVFRAPADKGNVKKHFSKPKKYVYPKELQNEYHVWGLEWTPDFIRFYIDGYMFREIINTHWHQALAINLNNESNKWFNAIPDDNRLDQEYRVKYVRVWQKPE